MLAHINLPPVGVIFRVLRQGSMKELEIYGFNESRMYIKFMRPVYLLLFLTFISCQHYSRGIREALEFAGENRIELEKVLKHYSQNSEDRLKLKAARFLIENMDSHFFVKSAELEAYYNTLDSIFSINNRGDAITKEQETL